MQTNFSKLQSNVLQLKMLKIPITPLLCTHTPQTKKHTPNFYFLNNAIKNRPVVVILAFI